MRVPLKERNDFKSFVEYCSRDDAQDQRLFQALRNWSLKYYEEDFKKGIKPETHFIYAGFDDDTLVDTFYWEDVGEDDDEILPDDFLE